MRRPRIHCPNLAENTATLSPEESRHVLDALRAKTGDEIILFDGVGGEAEGVVSRIARKTVTVRIGSVTRRPFDLSRRVTLAVAAVRVHRQGYLVEKCTELGVASLWPIITERSVARPESSLVEKWSRRAIEAAKQSGRAWTPQIAPPCSFNEAVARRGEFDACSLADTGASLPRFLEFIAATPAPSSVLVFVGPEGGWTDAERELAREADIVRTTLGPTVLRTETAAVAVCAAAVLLE